MKIYLTITFLLGALLGQAQNTIKALDNIQQRIDNAFLTAVRKDIKPLQQIANELKATSNKQQNRYLTYWEAYVHYNLTIVYLSKRDMDKGSKHNLAAVQLLDKLKNKNSEEYALLGMNTSIGIGFNPGAAPSESAKARRYYEKAAKLDKKNLRAYYGQGNSDFYTPKQYGGGLIAEQMFLKALSLKDTYSDNAYAPSWGREQVYTMLVRFYVREGQNNKALLYCKQGLKKYPENTRLKNTLEKLSK